MNFVQSSLTVGALRAAALSAAGSPPRRTWASHSCASERACSTVSSPYWPKAGLRRSPAFVRYWSMNTLRPDGVILHKKPGTRVSLSSTACAWGCAASIADLVSLILAMMTPRKDPIPKSLIGATSREVGSGFGKHRHMLNRSEEHTSELQSLMRISYAVFCLKTKT